MKHPYLAEENGDGSTSTGSTTSSQALDEAKLAELIKQNVSTSVKELLQQQADTSTQNQPTQIQPVQQAQEPDLWDTILDPKIVPRLQQANIRAEAAEDKVEFYSSDFWSEELESWLTEDDPDKRKKEKAEFRQEVEKRFSNLLQQGKGFKREAIAHNLLGEKIAKDRTKYEESIGKRRKRQEESALETARKAVSITSGNISNFTPQDIHAMSMDKMLKELGDLQF